MTEKNKGTISGTVKDNTKSVIQGNVTDQTNKENKDNKESNEK